MHPSEIEYWNRYSDCVATFLQDSFGSSLEMFDMQLFRDPQEVHAPDTRKHVALMLEGQYGDSQLKTIRLGDEYNDLTSSDIFIMPFDQVEEQVKDGEFLLI